MGNKDGIEDWIASQGLAKTDKNGTRTRLPVRNDCQPDGTHGGGRSDTGGQRYALALRAGRRTGREQERKDRQGQELCFALRHPEM